MQGDVAIDPGITASVDDIAKAAFCVRASAGTSLILGLVVMACGCRRRGDTGHDSQ